MKGSKLTQNTTSLLLTDQNSSQNFDIDSYQNNNYYPSSSSSNNVSNHENYYNSSTSRSKNQLDLTNYYDENLENPNIAIQKGFVLNMFNFFSFLTIISAIFVCFTQIISVLYKLDILFFGSTAHTTMSYLRIIIQFYDILFCIYAYLTEMEFNALQHSIVINNWVFRGILYIFFSLLTFNDKDTSDVWRPVLEFSGYFLFAMGCVYVFMVSYMCIYVYVFLIYSPRTLVIITNCYIHIIIL